MKRGFSLLELIFAIVVIGIIASFAIPKYLDTRDSAVISTIKRDLSSMITSIQAYHLIQGKIEKISDAISLSSENWNIEDTKATDKKECVSLEIKTINGIKIIDIIVNEEKAGICEKLRNSDISSEKYKLY